MECGIHRCYRACWAAAGQQFIDLLDNQGQAGTGQESLRAAQLHLHSPANTAGHLPGSEFWACCRVAGQLGSGTFAESLICPILTFDSHRQQVTDLLQQHM